MNSRNWNILCRNIRGLNGSIKWDAVRKKLDESGCSIVCIQEIKRELIDASFIRNFAPRRFDHFDYIPSIGASGGLLGLWHLGNIYGPCDEPARSTLINWFRNYEVDDRLNWIFLGDFNYYRSLEN
ncbi:hypothetical protein PVAP13_6NG114703 [Panicum virgatum]|uniref:Endonuclease/exonuclease/phosphatase domain-containing protein n=1 Tax=Panicum virgatum TaxID=38727 RepID=A0A8T0QZQ3_PANVG|nr:hypothetical protein PVAP13_6NG114703 [Panicum virgatum]